MPFSTTHDVPSTDCFVRELKVEKVFVPLFIAMEMLLLIDRWVIF